MGVPLLLTTMERTHKHKRMSDSNEYKIKVIDKMFKIIDVIEQEKQPIGVNDIARRSSLNAATTFRILRTLLEAGWIYQNQDEKYSAGYRLCSAFNLGKFYFLLKDVSYCVMRSLTDQEGEVLNLTVRKNEIGFLLQQSRTSKFADYVIQVDSSLPLYATSGGKILLSEMPEPLLDLLLGVVDFLPYTDKTLTNPDALKACLAQVRACGYATDIGESLQNTCCIGVPVRNPSGEIFAALSFSGLVNRLTHEKELYYVHLLEQAAQDISRHLFLLYTDALPRADTFSGQQRGGTKSSGAITE